MRMKRGLILLLSFILSMSTVFAYDLIWPKQKETVTDKDYALFVGRARNAESIVINDKRIYTAPNGAFAHTVKLKEGNNRIVVRSNYSAQVYRFRKENKPVIDEPLKEFEPKCAIVKTDETPLRSTPESYGMNRISHLFKDTTVLVNGSKGNFYRVFLSKDKTAWIEKKDVCLTDKTDSNPAQFITMDSKKFKNASIQTVKFSKNLPFTIEDLDNEIIFRIYNPELSESSVYTVNIPKPEKYTYTTALKNGEYTFKVSSLPVEIENSVIVIDAGHGGSEKGAVGCLGDEEKNLNLRIALELAEMLRLLGANVVMTRECDGNMSLGERVELAKHNHANIFISIHHNSIGNTEFKLYKHRGTSVYYFNKNAKNLASCIEKSVSKTAGTRKDGVRQASFFVIRPTEYTGVLVETAYMINPFDSVLYTSEDFAKNAAAGIANGILEFLNK